VSQSQPNGQPEDLIKFYCANCNHKIRVQKVNAGRKGKCQKCKSPFVVPQPSEPEPILSFSDIQLQPAPTRDYSKSDQNPLTEDQQLQMFRDTVCAKPDAPPERKLPWPIDVFLYPANVYGLTVLGIIIGIPIVTGVVKMIFNLLAEQFMPFLVFAAFFRGVAFVINIIIIMYTYWYLCECIRDSANGGLRAPDTLVSSPGAAEMFWQILRLIGCFIVLWGPLIYFIFHAVRSNSGINFLRTKSDFEFLATSFSKIGLPLLAYAIFFFPMGVLAVVMFDSLCSLNPLIIIPSIFSTFFQYLGILFLFYALIVLASAITAFLLFLGIATGLPELLWVLSYFTSAIKVYLFAVAAHALGRFYWRYQEKLNWDV
jgi:hypothetical protein